MGNFKKLAQKRLFLPVFSMILVMLINVVYDIATGSAPLSFFMISIKNGVLYGRLIDILNRGSEIAILAIGMTLVVSASGGTDISVGSVMSLYAGVCCMILAGYGNVNVQEYAHPLLVGIGAGLLVTLICGVFNGFLVAYMNIQPMVATLILWSAGRAVGLLLCNSQIVYVRVPKDNDDGSKTYELIVTGYKPGSVTISVSALGADKKTTYNASVTVEILPPEGQAVSTDPSDIDGASDDWSDNSIDGSSFTSGTASGWDDENSDTLDIIPNESQDDFSADAGSWESGDSGF